MIPSLPGVLASSRGRIMVAPYVYEMPNGGLRQYGGEPVRGQWDGKRYIYTLKDKTYKVARLVCEAFHGASPFHGALVMHDDENARNNRPDNLSWGTQKENLNAPGFIAYCQSRTGANSPIHKARARRNTAWTK
jgi:hypothetical protein